MKRAVLLLLALAALAAPAASATPVATTEEEREQLGRVFPEPIASTDFINHGTDPGGASEFRQGWELLEELYPGYVEVTSVGEQLGDPNAVSLGPDGKPAWDPEDSGDGLPFYVVTVTDESVPDRDKGYVLFLNAHPAEPCGQEGSPRFMEDLLIWRHTDPGHELDDGAGIADAPHSMTVREVLRRTKVFFVSTSPDGWAAGETHLAGSSNFNNADFNSNRVAYQDGWVFPATPVLAERGYSVLTQPEGAAVTRYLRQVRDRELGGRPFAVANDQHGPLPVGAILLHDQGNDPAKLDRIDDYGRRLEENMNEVFARYFTGAGLAAHQQAAAQAGSVRDTLLRYYTGSIGPFSEKAGYITTQWADHATIWEHLDYTVTGSYGGWAGSRSGLEADSISFETACNSQGDWDPAEFQLYVDNVRAADETAVVHAAQVAAQPIVRTYDLRGPVGFFEPGARVTDRDGNPSPPPSGFPGSPLAPQIEQAPYDVANTDYFRDLREVVRTPVREVRPRRLERSADRVASLVVADGDGADPAVLRRFAERGGNLVVTDGALRLLPRLVGVPEGSVRQGFAYMGYSDLDRDHPWVQRMHPRARQMFDPIGLGYPLLMERDQYWPCDEVTTECDESPTVNSAPIWTVERAAWENAGGRTIGTADPPEDRKFGGEGTATDKTSIGTLPVGEGRIVVFGALLPQPTEQFEHWFGLNAYTISVTGQRLLMRALEWQRALPPPRRCVTRRRFPITLPRGLRSVRVTLDGRRQRVVRRRGKRARAIVDLRERHGGIVRVRIVGRTKRGKVVRQVRRYRVCVAQR